MWIGKRPRLPWPEGTLSLPFSGLSSAFLCVLYVMRSALWARAVAIQVCLSYLRPIPDSSHAEARDTEGKESPVGVQAATIKLCMAASLRAHPRWSSSGHDKSIHGSEFAGRLDFNQHTRRKTCTTVFRRKTPAPKPCLKSKAPEIWIQCQVRVRRFELQVIPLEFKRPR